MQTREITPAATTPPRSTREAPKPENASESTLGGFSAMSGKWGPEANVEPRNREWTHLVVDGEDFILTEAQGQVVKHMAALVSADEFIVSAAEVSEMAGQCGRRLSQIFRGSPLSGRLFRHLKSPRGRIVIMLNRVVSNT